MPDNKSLKSKSKNTGTGSAREPFTTIDDLTQQADTLASGLKQLSRYKHPLHIRRGVGLTGKGVREPMPKNNNIESTQLKGAGRTYFLDIAQTQGGKSYLRITESRKGEGDKFQRNSINVFPEDAETFAAAVNQIISKLA